MKNSKNHVKICKKTQELDVIFTSGSFNIYIKGMGSNFYLRFLRFCPKNNMVFTVSKKAKHVIKKCLSVKCLIEQTNSPTYWR